MNMFKEHGILNEYGKEVIKPLSLALKSILESNDVKNMSASSLRALKVELAKMLSESFSNELLKK